MFNMLHHAINLMANWRDRTTVGEIAFTLKIPRSHVIYEIRKYGITIHCDEFEPSWRYILKSDLSKLGHTECIITKPQYVSYTKKCSHCDRTVSMMKITRHIQTKKEMRGIE
jgi:hypothetical protein